MPVTIYLQVREKIIPIVKKKSEKHASIKTPLPYQALLVILTSNQPTSIGSACARLLASQGVSLALTYSSNLSAITTLASELRSLSSPTPLTITTHQCDISSTPSIIQLCKDVASEHGRAVDILVSNAGHGKRIQDVWDIPVEEFEYTLDVNLKAGFLLVKGVVEGMREQRWGRIVFVGSIAAYGAGINGCRGFFPSFSFFHLLFLSPLLHSYTAHHLSATSHRPPQPSH